MSEPTKSQKIVTQFDPTELGYRLRPNLDRRQICALTNRLSVLAKNREERLRVLRIEWELLRYPPKIERRTLDTLEEWCSPDTSGDPKRRAVALALRKVAFDDLRSPTVPTMANVQKTKSSGSSIRHPAHKRAPKRKRRGHWLISAGLPDTNRRKH
jgi:hypothetical protein